MTSMHRFANPARFTRIADAILPWAGALMAFAFAAGIYFALFASPADYQQGETVRIMYVHVPSAWMAMQTYVFIAVMSAVALIWRHPLAEISAKAAAPVGAAFTGLALVTGMLWGQPMWGTFWVWDARLTSVLILFFLYLGYMALWRALPDSDRAGKAAAILALVGAVNIPVIKFSVDWWNTLHQPASVLRAGGPSIAGEMLVPLFTMFAAFFAYFVMVLLWRIKGEIAARKLRNLQLAMAAET